MPARVRWASWPRMRRWRDKIDDTITRLNSITEQLDKGKGTAGKFLKDPALYNNTNELLVETRRPDQGGA